MFRMRNLQQGTIKINIVNFTKTASLFTQVSYASYSYREWHLLFGQKVDTRSTNLDGTKKTARCLTKLHRTKKTSTTSIRKTHEGSCNLASATLSNVTMMKSSAHTQCLTATLLCSLTLNNCSILA